MEFVLTTAIPFVEKMFLLFLIFSFGGWIVEEVYVSIIEKKIVKRGFLIAPLCPIYGLGGIFITICLTWCKEWPVAVFFLAIIVSGIVEYIASFVLEKAFNARWWDYSDHKFNINGRVSVNTLIPFGLFGLGVIYLINPFLFNNILDPMPELARHLVAGIAALIFIVDMIVSFKVVSKVAKTAEHVGGARGNKDDTDEINAKVKEELKNNKMAVRFIESHPRFKVAHEKVKAIANKGKERIKEGAEKSKKAIKETTTKAKEKLKPNKVKTKKEDKEKESKEESKKD